MPKSQQKQCNFKKRAKDLNRCSSKEGIYMVNKHMKICLSSLMKAKNTT